jgi:hypothetical protein
MTNSLMYRMGIQPSTNKSGGAVAYGAVVIAGSATAKSFTTTTTEGYKDSLIGVVVEPAGIEDDAIGLVSWGLWAPAIALDASASLYDFIKTDGVAGQGTPHAAPMEEGDFALALETGTTPSGLLFGFPSQGAGFTPSNYALPVLKPNSNTSFSTVGSPDTQGHALLSAGTLNNEAVWEINLPAGTYNIMIAHTKSINRGIYHVYVEGVDVANFDGYNGSTSYVLNTITGIAIAGGMTEIKIKMEAKNGSSSDYFGVLYRIELLRTGA